MVWSGAASDSDSLPAPLCGEDGMVANGEGEDLFVWQKLEALLVKWDGLKIEVERGNESNKSLEVMGYREHVLRPEVTGREGGKK